MRNNQHLNVKDVFLFLIGNRVAIEKIAHSRWAILTGFLLVLTAGLARNYDHLDLLRDVEWIYGPVIASTVTSLIVFSVVKMYLRLSDTWGAIPKQYLSFLGLYWMTAPCAWIYGIPVESFTDLVTATKWNIAFLLIVSVWRVLLMIRSLVVLTKAGILACSLAVLVPSSAIMCVGSFYKGLSLVQIMGGVRLPPHTELLRDAAAFTTISTFYIAVASFFLALILWRMKSRKGVPFIHKPSKAPRGVFVFCLLAMIAWGGFSIPYHSALKRTHHLIGLIENQQFTEAVAYASQFERSDFSMLHEFPPDAPMYRLGEVRIILEQVDDDTPTWLKDVWLEQYRRNLEGYSQIPDEDREFIRQNIPSLHDLISDSQ